MSGFVDPTSTFPSRVLPPVNSTPGQKELSMPLCFHVSVLAIALIYYSWRDGYCVGLLRDKNLRERMAYMLWTAAHHCA